MNKLRILLVLTIIPLLGAWGGPQAEPEQAPAQNDPPYLIQMLMMAPAEAAVPQDGFLTISYADLRTTEQARPGVVTPATMEAFLGMDDSARRLWFANNMRQISTEPDLSKLASFDADMVNYLGFDYFEIDRTLYFGPPPAQGVIYGGHFDASRVQATLTRRTYTATTLDGFPVLCGPVGCEHGQDTKNWLPDLSRPDPKTFRRKGYYPILGGRLGQQEPIALPPGYLMATPDWQILGKMTAAAAGTGGSLYGVPEFRAIADFAVTNSRPEANGTLIQVNFFPPQVYTLDLFNNLVATSGLALDEATIQQLAGQYGLNDPAAAEALPLYGLGALVDRQEGSDQVHSIVLVYTSESDAQRAAAEMVKRIPQQSALLLWGEDRPVIDLVAPGYTLDAPQVLYNSAAERWLAIATVRVPMPGSELNPETGDYFPSSRLVLAWYYAMMTGDFMPALLLAPAQ